MSYCAPPPPPPHTRTPNNLSALALRSVCTFCLFVLLVRVFASRTLLRSRLLFPIFRGHVASLSPSSLVLQRDVIVNASTEPCT